MEDLFSKLSTRDLSLLKDENRNIRRKTLDTIKQKVFSDRASNDKAYFQSIVDLLLKPLLEVLRDPVERCREIATEIIFEFASRGDDRVVLLSHLIPVFVDRLSGCADTPEPTEEVRLLLVRSLNILVSRNGEYANSHLGDIIKILTHTITDPNPEVKKESCQAVVTLSLALPDTFHRQCESLLTPLTLTANHQHAKVRSASLEAIGLVIHNTHGYKLTEVVPLYAQKLLDQSPLVRLSVGRVAGRWLLDLNDRYSYFQHILPLMLTSLSDEVSEVREEASGLWVKAGQQFLEENQDCFKEKIDFPKPPPEFYPTEGCEWRSSSKGNTF